MATKKRPADAKPKKKRGPGRRFVKGQVANPAGRTPGVPNKINREWHEMLAEGANDPSRIEAVWRRYDGELASEPGAPIPMVALVWRHTFALPAQKHEITGAFDVVSHLTEAHRAQHAELSRLMAERAEAGKRAALEASATAEALLTTTAPEEKPEGDES